MKTLKKPHFQFLDMNRLNTLYIFILTLFFLFGCTINLSEEKKIENFIKSYNSDFNLKNIRSIIVIYENDGCVTCTNLFTSEQEMLLENNENLFILSATGSKVDISSFILDSLNNVLWDSNMDFSKLGIMEKSGIIYFDKNGKIIRKETNRFSIN